ncbi:MAG: SH3 domain-containing protein [Acidimicrobiales bacterium]|nr:SH3 domain-containing protein [Acidimicrobiales bacterium]
MRPPRFRHALTAIAVSLVLLGCGGDDSDDDAATGDSTTSSTTTTSSTSTTDSTTTSPSSTTADGDLPGEPIDIFPDEGAALAVVGVAADDELNIRAGPSVDFEVIGTAGPNQTGLIATGENRQLESGAIWARIELPGGDPAGWANTAFLLQPGVVDDVTSQLYPSTDDRPTGSLEDLAFSVADEVASDEPEPNIVISDGPFPARGEVAVDVIGLPDDSIGGYRLRVFAEGSGGSFTLDTVERTAFCRRGVTDGLCL